MNLHKLLHNLLDKVFHRATSFSVFFRIWLLMLIMIGVVVGLSFYSVEKTLRPQAKTIVEDGLFDSATVLANLIAPHMRKSTTHLALPYHSTPYDPIGNTGAWFFDKTDSDLHIYITDQQGVVVYDSAGKAVGQDFSRWNDVYLTLQGKYGARSTHIYQNGKDIGSVMYVARPIIHNGVLLGVVSVGKPTYTLAPYINKARTQLVVIVGKILLGSLVASLLIALWLRHSIALLMKFTQRLGTNGSIQKKPHFYLGKELNELSNSIAQMKETIENKAYVSEYVHTLTHELKSPLSAIKASSEILGGDIDEEERVNFAHLIGEQSDKITLLIDKLLTLATLEQPTMRLQKTPVDIKALLTQTLNHAQPQLKERNISVQIVGDMLVQADSFWLAQALQNAIDNAADFAISFLVIVMDKHAVHIINDTPALPSFVIERAFERYFSVRSDQNNKKGTGLGLPLVATVMRLHEGHTAFTQGTLEHLLAPHPLLAEVVFDHHSHCAMLTLCFTCTQSPNPSHLL